MATNHGRMVLYCATQKRADLGTIDERGYVGFSGCCQRRLSLRLRSVEAVEEEASGVGFPSPL
jgi:hypothetical protein